MKFNFNFNSRGLEALSWRLEAEEKIICSDSHSLLIFVAGQGSLSVEGRSFAISQGCAALLRPLAYCIISAHERLEYISISFSPDCVLREGDPLLGKLSFSGSANFYEDDSLVNALSDALSGLSTASRLSEEYKHEYALCVMRQILIILLSHSAAEAVCDSEALGARICEYINENLTGELSLEKIARAFFVSKFYLCRAFKGYVGSSIHSYIVAKRISLAKSLIDSGESASAVAYKVGFGDYSAFYRAYVKHVGAAPTEM